MKKFAFTLAEVLITLGIIGIVAAMTLPALVGHYKKVETSSRLKKFVSTMQQAIKMSELENGDVTGWTRGGSTQMYEDGTVNFDAQGKITTEFFMTYLAPYFKYVKVNQGKNSLTEGETGSNTRIYLADGSAFSIWNGDCMDIEFDVNGDTKPNARAKDIFLFTFCLDANFRGYYCGNKEKGFCSIRTGQFTTRTEAFNACKAEPSYCSRLLEFDNWEFKEDYPYKL